MEFLKTKLGIASNNNSSTSDKHEQFKSECIGRAYFTGLVVGPLTFSIVYFLQNNFTNQLKVRTETSYPAFGSLISVFDSRGYTISTPFIQYIFRGNGKDLTF